MLFGHPQTKRGTAVVVQQLQIDEDAQGRNTNVLLAPTYLGSYTLRNLRMPVTDSLGTRWLMALQPSRDHLVYVCECVAIHHR